MSTRRGIEAFDDRAGKTDCAKGKHLWLVTRIEPRGGSPAEQCLFKVFGRCAHCSTPGASDLLTTEQLPVNEKLFEVLHSVKLQNAMNAKKSEPTDG